MPLIKIPKRNLLILCIFFSSHFSFLSTSLSLFVFWKNTLLSWLLMILQYDNNIWHQLSLLLICTIRLFQIPLIVYEKVILFRKIHAILTEYLFFLVLNIQQTSCRDKTVGPQFGEGQKEKRAKREKTQAQESNGWSRRAVK